MADLAITPVIGMIYGYYPDNMSAVNYIVSGPMLVLVVASLLPLSCEKTLTKKCLHRIHCHLQYWRYWGRISR